MRRLTLFAAALLVGGTLLAPVARAQSDSQSLFDRLERLERDMQTMQRQVYRAGSGGGSTVITSPALGGGVTSNPPPGGADEAMPSEAAARMQVRLNQMEGEIRRLTGQLEEVTFSMSQATSRLDKLAADIDFRLRELEQKSGGGGAVAGAPATAGAAASGTAGAAAAGGAAALGKPAPAASGVASDATRPGSLGSGGTGPAPGPGVLGTIPADRPGAGQSAAATPAKPPSAPAPKGGSPQEQYEYAFSLLRQSDYDGAEKALKSFIDAHPNDPLAGNAQYWLGETQYVRGDYQQASVMFLKGYQKYPKSAKAPDSLLKLGLSLSQLGQKKEACAAFGRLGQEFPEAPDAVKRRASGERQKLGC